MNLEELNNELEELNERVKKFSNEYLLIGMANVDGVEGHVPLYMGEMTYEGVICHFSKILLQTAKESDKPLELVGRDLNLAMKMWLKEEGQKHEDNA
jgi:hypothetical protein